MAHPHSPADAAEGNSSPDDNSSGPRLGRKNRANAGEAPAQTPPGPKKSPRNGRRPHRKGRPHRRTTTSSRCLTALAALTLLLTACRIDAKFEFKEDGSAHTEIIFEDDRGSMRQLDGDCNQLKTVVASTRRFLAEAELEDITPPGGQLKCKITSKIPPDDVKFSTTDSNYLITLEHKEVTKRDLSGLKIRTEISMPGEITKTSVGRIKDNKVIINGLDYIADGFQIVSKKETSNTSSEHSPNSSKNEQFDKSGSTKGFPMWGRVGISCGIALAVLFAVMLALRARKRKRRCNGSYYDPRRYLDHTRQTGSHPPYGS